MGLTDEERRRLDELADELTREDPHLGRALSVGSSGRRRLWLPPALAGVLAVVSLPLAALGVGLAQPLLFAAGCMSLVVAVWIGIVWCFRRRPRRS
jgi:hypothetical protein